MAKFSVSGLKEAASALKTLDRKLKGSLFRKIHKALLRPFRSNIANAAPSTPNNSWKNVKNVKILNSADSKDGVDLGYVNNRETYMIRWHEKGTKVRTKRGAISARPWIAPAHDSMTPDIIKKAEKEYSTTLETILKKELKSISKKLSKL
jgi:hypothetical protein